MILCFNCYRETKELLDQLLQSGQYNDYAEIIAVAVANLGILESEIGRTGSLILGDHTNPQESPTPSTPHIQDESNQQIILDSDRDVETKSNPVIPTIFLLDGISQSSNFAPNLPSDVWIKGQEIPIDRWVFGQYNRLLPAKASCRALARLLTKNKKGISLDEATPQIAQKAAILGDFLKLHDEQNMIGRDDLLSAAFPTCDSDKSLQRFENQFIGSVNREGQISGLLVDFKLINRTGTKKVRLHLTEPGWQFAILPNPVLDGFQDNPLQKFSNKERNFLIDHIVQNLPAEDFAYRAIMSAIVHEANTPDTMDKFLQKKISIDTNRDISASFLSTQRSGAVSRMTDLGLVRRVRDGVRVLYEITDSGQAYLERS